MSENPPEQPIAPVVFEPGREPVPEPVPDAVPAPVEQTAVPETFAPEPAAPAAPAPAFPPAQVVRSPNDDSTLPPPGVVRSPNDDSTLPPPGVVPPSNGVLADVYRPVGSSYDPMPLPVSQARANNWMGIVALITGLIGMSLLAIIFGILGLSAAKKGKATNRGMSIWGIVLGAIWVVISAVLVGAAIFLLANTTTIQTAEVGDCYVSTVVESDELQNVKPVFGSCDTGTNAEIYWVGTYTGASSPSDADFQTELTTLCTSSPASDVIDVDVAYNYFVEYYIPYASDWDNGAHTVLCGVSTGGGPVDPAAVNE